jgi:tetratricopeptide (TPR) repeat protein
MCCRQWRFAPVYFVILFVRPIFAEQSQQNRVTASGSVEPAVANSIVGGPNISDRAQASVAKAIDQLLEYLKQAGRTERVALWNTRRGHPITIAEIQMVLDDFDFLMGHNQFRSAERLSPELQIIAEELQKESPPAFALVQLSLIELDDNIEKYDSALKRLNAVLDTLKQSDVFPLKVKLSLTAEKAHVLRKLGKHAEAEQLYLRLLKEADEHSESASKDYILSVKFEFAAMYADIGKFEGSQKWMPKEATDYREENGAANSERISLMLSTNVKYYLSEDKKDLDAAEDLCQWLIEQMQHYDGVSSPSYVAAIELMAKVRVAQAHYNEAVELLNKSLGIRAGLFGKDHPSIGRTQSEIERIRKLALEGKTTGGK